MSLKDRLKTENSSSNCSKHVGISFLIESLFLGELSLNPRMVDPNGKNKQGNKGCSETTLR